MSEPQYGGVQLLVIRQGLVHDWIFDEMLGWDLDTMFLFNFNWDGGGGGCLLVLYIFITGLWLMYHVRFAGGRVKSELQLRSRVCPMEYLRITKDVRMMVKCFAGLVTTRKL